MNNSKSEVPVLASINKTAQRHIFGDRDQFEVLRSMKKLYPHTDSSQTVHYTSTEESTDLVEDEDGGARRALTSRGKLNQLYKIIASGDPLSNHLVDTPRRLEIGNGVSSIRFLRDENCDTSPTKAVKEIKILIVNCKSSPTSSEHSTQAPATTITKLVPAGDEQVEGERRNSSTFVFTNPFHLSPQTSQPREGPLSSVQQLVERVELTPKRLPLSVLKAHENETASETRTLESHRYLSPTKCTESSTNRNRESPLSTQRKEEDPYQKLKQEFISQIASYQKKPAQNSGPSSARRLTPCFKEVNYEFSPQNQNKKPEKVRAFAMDSPQQSLLMAPHNSELEITFKKALSSQYNTNSNNTSGDFETKTCKFPDFSSNLTKISLKKEEPRNSNQRYVYHTKEIYVASHQTAGKSDNYSLDTLTIPRIEEDANESIIRDEKASCDLSWSTDSKGLTPLPKIKPSEALLIDESSIQAADPSFSYYLSPQRQQSLAHQSGSPRRSHALRLSLAITPIEEEAYESERSLLEMSGRYLSGDLRWRGEKIELAREMEDAGLKYFEMKDYTKAIQALSKSLVIMQNHLGRNNLEIATLLHKLGFVFSLKGDCREALRCYGESLEIFKKQPESEAFVAEVLQNMGNVYIKQQQPMKAKYFYSKSLELKLQKFGEAHREVAESMVNIANILKLEGKVDEAVVIYQQGTEILLRNSNNSEDLANASVAMNNLGLSLMDLDRNEEALSVFEECLGIRRGLFGNNTEQVQEIMTNIGNVRCKLGDVKGAVSLYQEALRIRSGLSDGSNSNMKSKIGALKKNA